MRRRLFHAQNTRNPWRCQAMTVPGFTITSAVRQPVHERDSQAQSHRSAFARRTRRGRDRWSTCSWWRSARNSRCSATRDRTTPRSTAKTEISTGSIARDLIGQQRQVQRRQQVRGFWQAHPDLSNQKGCRKIVDAARALKFSTSRIQPAARSISASKAWRTRPEPIGTPECLVEAGGCSTTVATEQDYFSVINQMSPCCVARVK
jgi:hypothetical protein